VKLRFTPPTVCAPGTVARLLRESYAALLEAEPVPWREESEAWEHFDADVYGELETVGACTTLSWAGEDLVGLLSFDPRQAPEIGVIGHNCILPRLLGRGYGKAQIEEMLRRFRKNGIREARVTTCKHPFFEPARRMYASIGFRQVGRAETDLDPRKRLIHYELQLTEEGEVD